MSVLDPYCYCLLPLAPVGTELLVLFLSFCLSSFEQLTLLFSLFFSLVCVCCAYTLYPDPTRSKNRIPYPPIAHQILTLDASHQAPKSRDLHLLPAENQPLLHRRNPLFLLHPLFYPRHFIVRFDIEFDFFAGKGAHSVVRKVHMLALV